MKPILFLFFISIVLTASAQNKTVQIRNHAFVFKTTYTDSDNGPPIKKVVLYRNGKKLLTHTLSQSEGDCNSESVEQGNYEVTDTSVIFYSYWARAGDAPVSPYGFRKQVYVVDTAGRLNLGESGIYLESTREYWGESEGSAYLVKKPKNAAERKLLLDYVSGIEKIYSAKFVFGKEMDVLIEEVREKLKKQIATETKNWESIYGDKLGGYKK